jgi:hypothetical protein
MPPAAITKENLGRVMKALPHESAAGPSGWTYEHIMAATTTSKDARSTVLCILHVRGDMPYLSCLLPNAKPAGGIRPFAINKVWYRLAAL